MTEIMKKPITTRTLINKGFTLAETLITLVIIGVVAALTIPNLIVKHQKEETVTRLKKAYSTIAQTTQKAIADNGPIETWTVEMAKSKEFADIYLIPYLNVAKNCGYESTGDCKFEWAYLNTPNNHSTFSNYYSKFILSDGTAIIMHAVNTTTPLDVSYISMEIDINGQKGPNVYGKDIFLFTYQVRYNLTSLNGTDGSGQLVPNFHNYPREELLSKYCCKTDSYAAPGAGCAALIMKDGWQIRDDYPW